MLSQRFLKKAAEPVSGVIGPERLAETQILIFNNPLDAAVTGLFMPLVNVVGLDAARVWWKTLWDHGPSVGASADASTAPRAVRARSSDEHNQETKCVRSCRASWAAPISPANHAPRMRSSSIAAADAAAVAEAQPARTACARFPAHLRPRSPIVSRTLEPEVIMLRRATCLLAALVALVAPPALAVDGVIEISQTSALAGGITSCDTPGFPVSICKSGSYRLTSNLEFPSATARGIEVQTNDVTIDLNGMTIKGQTVCATGPGGFATSCTPAGGSGTLVGAGVVGLEGDPVRTTVVNGRIVGAGNTCLFLGVEATLRDLQVSDCAGWGVAVGIGSGVMNVAAIRTLGFGVIAGASSRLQGIVARGNASDGVNVGSGSTATYVTANSNRQSGISAASGGHISDFSASNNGKSGVTLGAGSTANAGSIRDNGTVPPATCGLQGEGGAGYHGVAITATSSGNPATACGAVNLGANTCQGGVCPP